MDDELKNIPKCLVCLEKNKTLIKICSNKGKKLKIREIIKLHLWFEYNEIEDDRICNHCWVIIKEFNDFYNKIVEVHKNAEDIASKIKIESDELDVFKIKNNHEVDFDESEIKNEYFEHDQLDINASLKVFIEESPCVYEPPTPGTVDVLKNVQHEDISLQTNFAGDNLKCESSSDSEFNVDGDDFDSDTSYTPTPARKRKTNSESETNSNDKSETSSNNNSAIVSTIQKPAPKKSRDRKTHKKKSKSANEISDKQNEKYKEEDEEIRSVVSMKCELCNVVFSGFRRGKLHYNKVHNMEGYYKCCDTIYYKRNKLISHIQIHLHPNGLECETCKKTFINKRRLLFHMETHIVETEKKFKCDKCPKVCARLEQLQRHKLRHEEKNHPCDKCNKSYASDKQLQNHIQAVHNKAYIHICDICAKVFRNKAICEKHKKVVHSDVKMPPAQCQFCSRWLKHEISLKSHIKRHHDSDGLKHICDICGRESPNSLALYMHKKKVHIMQRIHKCNICEKAFKEEKTLREHMAALHTGELLYSCEFCPRKCNSSATMASHRKKVHTAEWQEEQMKKYL